LQESADRAVADAERLREDQAADTDDQAADGGPPHPVERQAVERVFGGVYHGGEHGRERPGQYADEHTGEQTERADEGGVRRRREERPVANDIVAHRRGGRAGQGHGNGATRLQLEEQQLDAQQDRGERSRECRGHTAGRARHQQRLALGAGEVEKLREHRAQSPTGHDDGSLGAEWSARSDGDGCGDRLQERHLGLDAAAIQEDGLDGFGDAMAADALGAVARHQADDEGAGDRHDDLEWAEVVAGRRDQRRIPALVKEQVCHQADQP